MIELTEAQRLALKDGKAVRLSGDEIGTEYVLVRADVFERIQALLNGGRLSLGEQRALLHTAGLRAGWDDPMMDVYDDEENCPQDQP